MSRKKKSQIRQSSAPLPSISIQPVAAPTPGIRSDFRGFEREFNPDYSDVLKDLRRIAILAGSFLGLLVVLSFFLR